MPSLPPDDPSTAVAFPAPPPAVPGGPSGRRVIDELLALGRDELARGSDGERALDLKLRLALLAWDGLGDRGEALRCLAGVDHPAALGLRLQMGLSAVPEVPLPSLVEAVRGRGEATQVVELAEALLFRGGDASRAADLLAAAGAEAREGLLLALALAGRFGELLPCLERIDDRPHLLEAAAVAQDRLGARDQARSLVRRAAKRPPTDSRADDGYAAERMLDLAADERSGLLRAKIDLLGADTSTAGELAATRYLLAATLEGAAANVATAAARREPSDEIAEADALLSVVCAGVDFGLHLALHARARVAESRKDFTAAARAWHGLAERAQPSPWSSGANRRAAELFEARANEPAAAEALYQELHAAEPGNPAVARALVRLLVARELPGEAAKVIEQHARARGELARPLLTRAARAAEASWWRAACSADETAALLERWREIAGPLGQREALEGIARIHRRTGERLLLAQTYRRLAPHLDPRRAATHLTVAGCLALDAGVLGEAEELLDEAVAREPRDLLAHAARAIAARASGNRSAFAAALAVEAELVGDPALRARLLLQHARVANELGDAAAAAASSSLAERLAPDDPTTVYELSLLVGELGQWERAVELRRRAASRLGGPVAATWLWEVGAIHERHLGDDEQARQAYEDALAWDPENRACLAALAALHRRHERLDQLLDVLRRELRLAPNPEAQLALHLGLARAVEEAEARRPGSAPIDVALAAYRDALRIDALDRTALAGMERLCRREGRWAELAEALSRIPEGLSAATLYALADAYEHLGSWDQLAVVREQLVLLPEVIADPPLLTQLSRQLAELYEQRLGDLDGAARAWHRVDEVTGDLGAVRALQRIYETRGRPADLAASIERELLQAIPAPRAVELWLRLGELRHGHLGRLAPAAEAYERALELAATLPSPQAAVTALVALGDLYARLDRPADLERVLEVRATAAEPRERATLLLQKGDLLERSGDLDGALRSYAAAFASDPSNRAAFTTLERTCYRRERWRDALSLYDLAIDLVEVQKSRAYRLSDLYARRGQVLLQYLDDSDEAARCYLRVLELDPEADSAQAALERVFFAKSDWDGLIGVYERRADLLQEDSRRTEVLRRAARVAGAKLKDPRRAAQLYERLHAVDPTDTEALDALERHYELAREWDKLVDVLRTRLALTAGGDDAIKLYLRIAKIAEENRRDPEQAAEAYRKILDIAPSHREALDALGRLCESTERWAEFVDVTRRQIRVVTDRAQKALLYFKCGSVMESKFAKDDDAIRYYDAAIRTSPSCLPAVHGLRDLYLRREDWTKVIQTLELEAKLWTDDKERAGVLAHIGSLWAERLGEVDRAISYFESALAVDKGCLPANRALFEVYFARGDYARALPLGQVLTQKVMREGDPVERSEFYRKRAVVARETGDLAAAAESLVVSLEIRPDNLVSLELLVELCRRHPEVYDFGGTFHELEKVCRKREAPRVLARVLVGRGVLLERSYSIDEAERYYREAISLASDDFPVVDALVDLDLRMRRFETAAAVLDAFLMTAGNPQERARARLRQAEIYSDGMMDPRRAAEALRALLAEQPGHREGHFRLAGELYLLGAYGEALRVCERLIQIAAAPGETSPPESLARYYDYLGRVTEAMGDPAAVRSYRRAVDLDPAYAPAVMSLMRRAAASGDSAVAARLSEEAMAAATPRGSAAVLPLLRGLARFHESQGDRDRAVESYRQILARDPDSADDRVALATLCAQSPALLQMARDELQFVLARDLRNAPAYRLLMEIYANTGEIERATRVASILVLLGYAGRDEIPLPPLRPRPRRAALSDAARRSYLLPPLAGGALSEALAAAREALEMFYGPPQLPPAAPVADPSLRVSAIDVQRLLGVEAEILIGEQVPGGAIAFEAPKPTAVLDTSLLLHPDTERRFLLGRALEPLRGGYALALRLRPEVRVELGGLLAQFLRPESERDAAAQAFIAELPRRSQKALDRLGEVLPPGGLPPPGPTLDAQIVAWLDALAEGANRAGLVACDDIGAAVGMLAHLAGEELALYDRGAVALGLVPGDAALVRFYLSDAYHALRSALFEQPPS